MKKRVTIHVAADIFSCSPCSILSSCNQRLPVCSLSARHVPLLLHLHIWLDHHNAATTRKQGLPPLPPEKSPVRRDASRSSLLELSARPSAVRSPGAQIKTVGELRSLLFLRESKSRLTLETTEDHCRTPNSAMREGRCLTVYQRDRQMITHLA